MISESGYKAQNCVAHTEVSICNSILCQCKIAASLYKYCKLRLGRYSCVYGVRSRCIHDPTVAVTCVSRELFGLVVDSFVNSQEWTSADRFHTCGSCVSSTYFLFHLLCLNLCLSVCLCVPVGVFDVCRTLCSSLLWFCKCIIC